MIRILLLLMLSCIAVIVLIIAHLVGGMAYLYDCSKKRFDRVSSRAIRKLGGRYISKGFESLRLKVIVLILVCIFFASCSSHDKVIYLSGEVGTVYNPHNVGESGDTLVIEHSYFFAKGLGMSTDDDVWGIYLGTIPETTVYSDTLRTSRKFYELAIKQ